MKLDKELGFIIIGLAIILLIVVTVVKVNVDNQGEFMCQLVADNPDMDMKDCPAHNNPVSWLVFLAFGISFALLGIGGVLVFYNQQVAHKKKVNVSKLSSEEKSIVILLEENEGSLYQSILVKETGLSKVKITRILDGLEGKGIIERKRRGMTNIVILK